MRTQPISQGSDAWLAFRRSHFNASDAAAMLGISPYKTRAQLLQEYATGIVPEVDRATQARFDRGHELEAAARAKAEEIIGQELYPVVGTFDEWERLSASFDGLTMDESAVWEHKTLNAAIAEAVRAGGNAIPDYIKAQIQQQLLVSGAEKALFPLALP